MRDPGAGPSVERDPLTAVEPPLWKISDPDPDLPSVAPGGEPRVLLPQGERFTVLADKLTGMGAEVRRVRYLVEDEIVTRRPEATGGRRWVAQTRVCGLTAPNRSQATTVTGRAAAAASDAFDIMWQDHRAGIGPDVDLVPAATLVPPELLRFFPFPTLNPAQTQALPEVFRSDENLVVVAPTGAGKTVVGMATALRTVVQQGRKCAWLVPQRSLTDELDRELDHWRQQGLRVERLSGEHSVDLVRIRDADLWVATTEKFEAICRASTFREALAEVGALVVDEIHLLGDPARGAVLEALLARVRDNVTTRIVGLSATISNAEQISGWLHARLLRVDWRPSRLTWQLPAVPAHADFTVTEAARTRLAAAITAEVARDGGSVVVFCGSKRNVRRTAMVIAAARNANVSGLHTADPQRTYEVCRQAGIGLHYQGWEYRQESEQAFRRRELDVLVATSTMAAGVNLPARAVIVQDTQVGFNPIDVATVQQMFGRAGRVGAGENEGWAFLIVDETERPSWQSRLVAGHTVDSQMYQNVPEHVLSEAVQRRIGSPADAEQWWTQTLAHHQGQRNPRAVREAADFLVDAGMLAAPAAQDGDQRLAPTELGRLTARMMVPPLVCHQLRHALAQVPVPATPEHAERLLIDLLAGVVPKLAQAAVDERHRAAVAHVLALTSPPDPAMTATAAQPGRAPVGTPVGTPGRSATGASRGPQRGTLARAAMLTVAHSPDAFRPGVRHVAGIPYSAMYPILEEAPRYLHWLASQGLFGTVHPWCAIVAADLERRIAWRDLQPPRGSGRLLWACEQMATPSHADQAVPRMWAAARARGHTSPDWTPGGRPRSCQLDQDDYRTLLEQRATSSVIVRASNRVRARGPAGSVLSVWSGPTYRITPVHSGEATVDGPFADDELPDAAVFTWRGDYRSTGWLATYNQITG